MAVERAAGGTSLIDVLDRVLDKGIVIDAWVRVSLVGIDLITVEARVVVASIDTYLKYSEAVGAATAAARPALEPARPYEEIAAENVALRAQLEVLLHHLFAPGREVTVVLPPVESYLFRLVDRTDHQTDPDRQQLDFRQRDLDVARHDQTFVQHAVEHVNKPGVASAWAWRQIVWHAGEGWDGAAAVTKGG